MEDLEDKEDMEDMEGVVMWELPITVTAIKCELF
jgi:hypothetical protein